MGRGMVSEFSLFRQLSQCGYLRPLFPSPEKHSVALTRNPVLPPNLSAEFPDARCYYCGRVPASRPVQQPVPPTPATPAAHPTAQPEASPQPHLKRNKDKEKKYPEDRERVDPRVDLRPQTWTTVWPRDAAERERRERGEWPPVQRADPRLAPDHN